MDLIKKMLEKDPLKRISAEDALNHEFFADSFLEALNNIEEDIQTHMIDFKNKNNL